MKAVIFDLDGTLSDSLESIAFSANSALEAFGFQPFETERYKQFVGDGVSELIKRCLINSGDHELQYYDQMLDKYHEIFGKNCTYHVEAYEGIKELLEELRSRNIRIAVLSNKPHKRTVEVVEKLFGKGYFHFIQGQTPEIKRKPSPDGALMIMRSLGVSSSECIYVGDTDTDMQTGKAAGLFTVGVLWGFRDREELEKNHADAIAQKPSDLLRIIRS